MDDRESDYGRLISPIEDKMIGCVWRIVRDPDDADDAFQEAMATIWRRWDVVRTHPNPQALILRICINAAYSHLRQKVRQLKWLDADDIPGAIPDPSASPFQAISDREVRSQVLGAIGDLPKNQARAILMHVVEDMSYSDTAAAMHCSEATVRKHVERARVRLRGLLRNFASSMQV